MSDLRDMVCESCDRILYEHDIYNTSRGIVIVCPVETGTKGTYREDANVVDGEKLR